MNAVIIRKYDLHLSCKGLTVLDENDDFNVYLNSKYSAEVQADALHHEFEHIRQGHFYRYDELVSLLEQQAEYKVV